jgi:hypothetical protein
MQFTVTDSMIKNAQSLDGALVLGILASLEPQKGEWFVVKGKELMDISLMSNFRQQSCLGHLASLGLIEVVVRGMPASRHIRLNHEAISKNLAY